MAKAYYSTVFEQTADQIWSIIRDFNNYKIWGADCGESQIEDGKTGETVGAIRRFLTGNTITRQRLLAQSDRERFQVYEFCDPSPLQVQNYEATLRVTPIIDGNSAFVEWSATFDCAPSEHDRWVEHFRKSFARWLESLRSQFANAL